MVIRHDKSGKGSYENIKGGARYSTSTGGTITGKHAHVIINDDPVNPKQAESPAMRLQANDHTKTLSSRKVDKKNTPMVTIMQRLHDDDVTGYLLKKKKDKIRHICLPAEVSERVNPPELKERYIDGLLDPVRIDREVIDEARLTSVVVGMPDSMNRLLRLKVVISSKQVGSGIFLCRNSSLFVAVFRFTSFSILPMMRKNRKRTMTRPEYLLHVDTELFVLVPCAKGLEGVS